jgi:imidazolonepropionase-like amidohydrolase
LDADEALAAITTGVAKAFDLQDELGSVRRGRRAELLIMNGDPLSAGTQIQFVVSGGEVVVEPKE